MTGTLIIPASALAATPDCCGSVVPAEGAADNTIIDSDGWFPPIALAAFRAQARVTDAVTVARQREAILSAMIRVGDDLAEWADARRAAGAASLDAVTDQSNPRFGGETRLAILYRQAIYAEAKALLIEKHRDIDTTTAGDRNAASMDPSIGELRRDRAHAIRAMLQRGRTTVALI